MIYVSCQVDEIQIAIDEYLNLKSIVDEEIDSITTDFIMKQMELNDWNPLKYLPVYGFIRLMMILEGFTTLDDYYGAFSSLPLHFHMMKEGEDIVSRLQCMIKMTPEETTAFILSGCELEFVSFFCTSWCSRDQ